MFNKKRKIRGIKKYRFSYGKSPAYTKKIPVKKSSKTLLKKQNPRKKRIKKFINLTVAVAVIIIGIYAIFFSKYFLLTQVRIDQVTFENEELNLKIKTVLSGNIGKNLIFLNEEDIELQLLSALPEIEEVKIRKNYPDSIEIEFSKFPLTANVISESKNIKKTYIINSIGYATKENVENPSLPYIRIKSEEPVNIEIPIIESAKLQYMIDMITYFEEKFGMKVKEIDYKKTAREAHILTEKDFYVWIDIQRPYEDQLRKLKKALIKLDIYNESLQYIDLRIAGESGDKIIYKRR